MNSVKQTLKAVIIFFLLVLTISFTAAQEAENQQPVNILDITNLDGTVEDIQDDPLNPEEPNRFLEATDATADTDVTTDFEDPSRNLVEGADQEFQVRVRRTDNSNRNPEVTINLLEDGGEPETLVDAEEVSDPDGEVFTGTWDASQLEDISGQNVEIEVIGGSTGGRQGDRNTVEVGAIQWEAQVEELDDPDVVLNNPIDGSVFDFEADIDFNFDVETFDEAAEARLVINETVNQTFQQDAGTFQNYLETVGPFDPGYYEWYVEAEGDNTFDQSETRDFTVEEAQDPDIDLISPADGAEFDFGSEVNLEFDVETFDEDADVDLFLNDELVEEFETQAEGTVESYSYTTPELEDGEYTWRVEVDGENTFSDDSRTFTVNEPQNPGINLVAPSENEIFEFDSDIDFEFEVETFEEDAEVRFILNDTVEETYQQPSETLESYIETVESFDAGYYEWQIEAEGDNTFTESDVRSFTVEEPEEPEKTLINPADQEVFGYEEDIQYEFEIETKQEDTQIALIQNGVEIFTSSQTASTTETYTHIEENQDRGDYQWKVETTTNELGTTESETRDYTVEDPEIAVNAESPADRNVFSGDTREVDLEWSLQTEIEGETVVYLNNTQEDVFTVETTEELLDFNTTVEVSDNEYYEWYAEFESDESDVETSDTRSFTVEESSLSENLIDPNNGEALDNTLVEFVWEIESDDDYTTELYVNGNLESTQSGPGGEVTTFTFEDEYSEGINEWFVTAEEDSTSENITSATRDFVIDTQEPFFSEESDDSDGEVVEGEIVNVSVLWESQEADLGTGYLFENSSGTMTEEESFEFGSNLVEYYNTSIDTTGLSGETVCWRQEVEDEAGNLNSTMNQICFDVLPELDIQTDQAEEITFSSAVLNGELLETDEFDEVDLFFEFRETGSNEWIETTRETVANPTQFNKEIEELNSNTEYEFRAVAAYSDVQSTGSINQFTTEEQPNIVLEQPEGGATEAPPVEFEFTPFCDNGCEEADLFFNSTEPALFNWATDKQDEWDQGSFANITSVDSVESDYIRLEEVLRMLEEFADTLTTTNGTVTGGTLADTEVEDGNTLDIEQDLQAGDTVSETFVFEGESAQTLDVSNTDQIDVVVEGAGGGEGLDRGDLVEGGSGGFIEAEIDVSSFDEIELWVGEGGEIGGDGSWGRFDGGASGGTEAGSGGGSTEIVAGDGTFLAAADAGGGAFGETEPPAPESQGGGGGARGGLGGTADSDGQDAEGNGFGGDGGDEGGTGGDGGQELNEDFVIELIDQEQGAGSGQNQDGEIFVESEENDKAELDTRLESNTDAVNPVELEFEAVASTSGNPFTYSAYDFSNEEYIELAEIDATTLTSYSVTVCSSGCDLEGNPENFINEGVIETRFESTDNQQDTLSIDLHTVNVESDEFEETGTYESRVFDAEHEADWLSSTIEQDLPAGTTTSITYGENSSGTFEFYDSIEDVPNSRYLKFNADLEGDRLDTPEIRLVDIEYESPETIWESRENLTTVTEGETNIIEYEFTEFNLPETFDWNIKLTESDDQEYFAESNRTVSVTEPVVDLEMQNISIYDVTDETDKRNSGDLLASGLNETFEIEQQEREKQYRFSFEVKNTGLEDWEIGGTDTLNHQGINETWQLQDIYYDINGDVFETGEKNQETVSWNTSNGGVVAQDEVVKAEYIVQTDTTSSNFYDLLFEAEAEEESEAIDLHELDKTKYGFLDVNLEEPPSTFTVQQNTTFDAITEIVCREGLCGGVDAAVRYNDSSDEPNRLIPVDEDEPFYLIDDTNTRDCGELTGGDRCTQSWQVNATGEKDSVHLIDVSSTSSLSEVSSNSSENSEVTIGEALVMDIEWDVVDFGAVSPGEQEVPAQGNKGIEYNITIPDNSISADRIEVASEDLNNSQSDGYSIDVENMGYNLEDNPDAREPLTEDFQIVEEQVSSGTTLSTFYWLNVPDGIVADTYTGVIRFEAYS